MFEVNADLLSLITLCGLSKISAQVVKFFTTSAASVDFVAYIQVNLVKHSTMAKIYLLRLMNLDGQCGWCTVEHRLC